MENLSYQYIHCEPITPTIGAEVSNVDLACVNDAQFAEIFQAFLQYKVIFFREQSLDQVQLCEISRRFGPLMKLPFIKPLDGFPEIIAVLKEAEEKNMGVFGGDWHSDFSFIEEPPMASVLYSVEVPPVGGDTVWSDMSAAYNALPEETKTFLKGARVIHIGAPYGTKNPPAEETQFNGSIQIDRNNPEADTEVAHPAVCLHPQTKEETLFISPTYTFRFAHMDQSESEPILKSLYNHCTKPEFTCRFRWSENTLAVWDNRSTMHYAVNDYDGHRRLLYRTAIAGHRPVAA